MEMRPELAGHAARQCGLVTRRQVVAAGYTERELRTLTAVGGRWIVVRRGVYVARDLWERLDVWHGQWLLRDRAAHLAMHEPHVLSHDSAARAHGVPLLRPASPLVHITRAGVGGSRTEHGVKHHLGKRLPALDVAEGLPVTGLVRTAVDLGREHGLWAGVVACDAVARRGAGELDFLRELRLQRCWPGVATARAAVALRDDGAENARESLARLLVEELGIGRPQTQFPVRAGGRTFWVDLRVGCHLFEFDGRIKLQSREEGGVADRPASEVVREERKRQQLICAEGLGMSRIDWDDFWGPARARCRRRLLAEYAVTQQRFGDVLPEHLAATAARLAPERLARIGRARAI